VSAQDKASGKSQKVTITSDKGRLSEDEIERMIKEAEEHAETDRLAKENIEAKNQLESYLYNLRNSVQDSLKDKIEEADKESLSKAISEALTWLEGHPNENKTVYEEKRKEIEQLASPIISKAYNANSSNGRPDDEDSSSSSSADSDGPSVEEVD
jgi:molecular chaperone DnaK (HSP70)